MAGAFCHGEQAGGFALHFDEGAQVFQVRAEALGDFAGGVEFEDETAAAFVLAGTFVVVLDSSSSPLSPFGGVGVRRL